MAGEWLVMVLESKILKGAALLARSRTRFALTIHPRHLSVNFCYRSPLQWLRSQSTHLSRSELQSTLAPALAMPHSLTEDVSFHLPATEVDWVFYELRIGARA